MAAVLAACSPRPQPAAPEAETPGACEAVTEEDLSQAVMLAAGGHLHRALALAEAADRRCSDATSRWVMAEVLADLGLDRRAIAAFERYIEVAATERDAQAARDSIAVLRKRPPAVRPQAGAEDRQTALLLYRDGVNLRLAGKPDDAIRQLRRSYALLPHPLTIVQIALAHEQAGRAVDALETHERALAIAEQLSGSRAVARLLRGHVGTIEGLVWSRDGRRVVTAGAEGAVKVWDPMTAHVIHSFPFPVPSFVAISGDGGVVAAAGRGGEVAAWDSVSGEVLARFTQSPEPGFAAAVELDRDGTLLVAVGAAQAGAQLHPLRSQRPVTVLGAGRTFDGAYFGRDPAQLALTMGSALEVWDAIAGKRLRAIDHAARIGVVAFDGTGARLAGTDHAGALLVWDAATLKTLRQVTYDVRGGDLSWSGDGRLLATSGLKALHFWDGATLEARGQVDGRFGWVALSADGAAVATANVGPLVEIREVGSGQVTRTLGRAIDPVTGVGFGAGGRLLAAASGSGVVDVWRLDAVRAPRRMEANRTELESLAVDPGGRWLVTASQRTHARRLDLTSGKGVNNWYGAAAVAVSADGSRIASAGERHLQVHAADGRRLLGTSWDDARTWAAVAFAPDGARLAVAGDPYLVVRKVDGGQLDEVKLRSPATALAWPAGDRVASGHQDGRIRLWQVGAGAPPRELEAHTGPVHALAASPDGKLLASAGNDGRILLWDLQAQTPAPRPLAGHQAAARAVAFAPGGRLLASGGDDGVVLLWDVASGAKLATLYVAGEQWLVLAEDGRIDGAQGRAGGAGLIYWQVGAIALPGVTAWDRAYTPGLVRALAGR